MKKNIILIAGDPNSINSEIIYKSWKKIDKSQKKNLYLIGNFDLMKSQLKRLNYPLKLEKVVNFENNISSSKLKVIDVETNFKNPFKLKKKDSSKYVISCLNYAHKLTQKQNIKGIINCSIDKKLLKKNNIGVTEFLASKCNIKDNSYAMLIWNKNISVSPITTHLDLRQVSKSINSKKIVNKVKLINSWFKKNLRKKPKIAILGLNPHNAELKRNSEEKKVIIPAILKLKKLRINVTGPHVADTIFINEYKHFDVIVGMYHDQVLAPFKTMFKFNAINITLGLKYLRVSPDHGTSTRLIGKNQSNPESLLRCINFVNKF